MAHSQDSAFDVFCNQRKKDLQRISRHTCGEYEFSDVKTEAWLMAEDMRNTKGLAIDWIDQKAQNLLLSYLYQHLVRYTELNLRYAVRLDHWANDDGGDAPHPLLNKLAADRTADPLIALSAKEESLKAQASEPDCHYSLASAYIYLLRRFDNKMTAVADHLLISLSYCYAHYAKVRMFADRQHPMPIHQATIHDDFLPRAWRHFRLRRAPRQLAFDFETDQHPALDFA
jgi:hypothetical protein